MRSTAKHIELISEGRLHSTLASCVLRRKNPLVHQRINERLHTTSPIYIAAKSLAHLCRAQLVSEKHVLAKVLCDENGSCATRGHMVVSRGNPMCMSVYSREHASCEVRTMEVNSPRYERAMLVASDASGLELTALAARFNTRAEEVMLYAAVRASL